MTRLIDADSIPWDVEGIGEIPVITKEEIDQMPEAVVRCKDCGWREDARGLYKWCYQLERNITDVDFCSRAERKEE